jgi:hypothetical protein
MPQSHAHLCRRAFHQSHRSNISTLSRPPTVTLYSSLPVFTCYVIAWEVFVFTSHLYSDTHTALVYAKDLAHKYPGEGYIALRFSFKPHFGRGVHTKMTGKGLSRAHDGTRCMGNLRSIFCYAPPLSFWILALLALGCNTRTSKRLCAKSTGASFFFLACCYDTHDFFAGKRGPSLG